MPRGLALLLAGAITLTAWFLAFRPEARLPAAMEARGLGTANGTWRPAVERSEADWRRLLLPLPYDVLRRGATERAFTGAYWNHHAVGTYRCAACGAPLFGSRAKFDSGTGWPSFTAPLARGAVVERDDPGLREPGRRSSARAAAATSATSSATGRRPPACATASTPRACASSRYNDGHGHDPADRERRRPRPHARRQRGRRLGAPRRHRHEHDADGQLPGRCRGGGTRRRASAASPSGCTCS